MSRFPHQDIEAKWQARWEETGAHRVALDDAANKLYVLVMFSYPSSDKLHVLLPRYCFSSTPVVKSFSLVHSLLKYSSRKL